MDTSRPRYSLTLRKAVVAQRSISTRESDLKQLVRRMFLGEVEVSRGDLEVSTKIVASDMLDLKLPDSEGEAGRG